MKRLYFFLLVIAVCFLQNSMFGKQSKTILAIEAAENTRYRLMINADTAALADVLANSLVYIHSNGKIDTKQSFLQSIGSKELVHKNIVVYKKNIRIYRRTTAIITGECEYDIDYKGKPMKLNFVYTNVYYRLKGHWLLVNRQTCKKDE